MERNLLFEILRILTPEEIGHLATLSVAEEKKALTEIMEERFFLRKDSDDEEAEAGQAKILPFDASKDIETEEEELISEDADCVEVELEVEEEENEEESRAFRLSDMFKAEEVVVEEKVDTIKFILEEKERFKKSRKDLKGKEILKLYQSNASVSIEQERKNKKNLSKSAHSGVLVNKKQA